MEAADYITAFTHSEPGSEKMTGQHFAGVCVKGCLLETDRPRPSAAAATQLGQRKQLRGEHWRLMGSVAPQS